MKEKITWRKCAAGFCAALGVVSWLYLGAYRLWRGPVMDLVRAHLEGNVTLWRLLEDFFAAFIWLTLAGTVWCLWYILRGYIKDRNKHDKRIV